MNETLDKTIDRINARNVKQTPQASEFFYAVLESLGDSSVGESNAAHAQEHYVLNETVDTEEQRAAKAFAKSLGAVQKCKVPSWRYPRSNRIGKGLRKLRLAVSLRIHPGKIWRLMRTNDEYIRHDARARFANANRWLPEDFQQRVDVEWCNKLAILCIHEGQTFDARFLSQFNHRENKYWCPAHVLGQLHLLAHDDKLYRRAFVALAARQGKKLLTDREKTQLLFDKPGWQKLLRMLDSKLLLSTMDSAKENLICSLAPFPWTNESADAILTTMDSECLVISAIECIKWKLLRTSVDERLPGFAIQYSGSVALSEKFTVETRVKAISLLLQARSRTGESTATTQADTVLSQTLRVPQVSKHTISAIASSRDPSMIVPLLFAAHDDVRSIRESAIKVLGDEPSADAIRGLHLGLNQRPEDQVASIRSWLRNPGLNPILHLAKIVERPRTKQADKLPIYVDLLLRSFDEMVHQVFRACRSAQYKSEAARKFFDRYEIPKPVAPDGDTAPMTEENTEDLLADFDEDQYVLDSSMLIEIFRRIVRQHDADVGRIERARSKGDQQKAAEDALTKFFDRKIRDANDET